MTAFPTDKPHCAVCGESFDSAEELGIHKRNTGHITTDETGFSCLHCGERFEEPEAFREHLKEAHKIHA